MKRDDLLGLAGGGNKTRKLEFVVADALTQGADTLITCGGLQSNHCRLTAAAAVKEGIKCRLVLIKEEHQTYDPTAGGNNLLYHLLGVESITVIDDPETLDKTMEQTAKQVLSSEGKPYLIPMGASNPIGILGYMACAREIVNQASEMDVHFDYVICPNGSGGTQAGLIIGMNRLNYDCTILGMNVSRSKYEQQDLLRNLIDQTITELDIQCHIKDDEIICFDESVGPGYTIPTAEMIEAVKITASTEGILLDPVYSGKAMAGLISLVRRGYFKKDDKILFIHTGGTPALYTRPELFID
jgi:D-cysteine desulfhydrase